MTYDTTPLRGSRRSAFALIALLAPVSAQTAAEPLLEPLIVSALRVPQAASTVTSAVTVLDPQELENQGILQLRDALNASPGVISTSTAGQTGAVGGLFVRGTTTAESLMVVDGIRMNGSGTQLGNIFATGRSYDIGSLEVLRGPQAAIHGGESIGGVVWMETPRGCGEPAAQLSFEAGSFNSQAIYGKYEGGTHNLSYYLAGGYEETDNDAPLSRYRQGSTAMRVEAVLDETWSVGTTFRLVDGYYQNGGASDDYFDNTLATLYATGRISDVWTTRFTLGHQQQAYDNISSFPYDSDLEATTLSTDQEFKLSDSLRLLAGGFFHHDSFKQNGFQSVDLDSDRYGLYLAAEWDATENLTTTAALRWEDYDSHGEELTWRLGSAYRIPNSGTTVRGSIGTAFRAPTYLDLYYVAQWGYMGNPNLESQTSLGWDLGIEQKIGGNHTVSLTWFRNLLDNAIDTWAYPMPVNLSGTTVTEGTEMAWRSDWLQDTLSTRLAWTWLHHSLKDQPTNAATATVQWKPCDKTTVGLGATHLSSRSWGGDKIAAYTIARVFGSYQLTGNVKLHARIENALDEEYELFSYTGWSGTDVTPGAGTGLYAGLTIDW